MPTYEYECLKCRRVFEVRQRISEPALTMCDVCGGEVRRLLSAAPFILKGGGWYVTDYPSSLANKRCNLRNRRKSRRTNHRISHRTRRAATRRATRRPTSRLPRAPTALRPPPRPPRHRRRPTDDDRSTATGP